MTPQQNQEAKGKYYVVRSANTFFVKGPDRKSAIIHGDEQFAQQIIDGLNAKSEWIRVSERLPEKDGRYEVVTSCGADKERVDCEYFYAHPDLKIWSGHFEVIAWRELPTPPKDL
jgi:hypothetical protein